MDYSALAKQFGGTQATGNVDYSALAKQYGGTTQAVEQADPEKTLAEKSAGVLDMIFGGGKIGEAIGTGIGYALASPEEKKFYDTSTPTKGQLAGSALQSAALFAPVGKIAQGLTTGAKALGIAKGASAIGKIGSGALSGGAFDVALNLQEGKTGASALTPGLGAGIGAAIPGAGVIKNVAQRFGHDTAPRVINSLIKPLAKDFSYGKNPGRAVAESKIIANNFEELATKIREVRQATGQEIGALGKKLSTKPIVDISDSLMPLDEAMRTAASQNNPTLLSRLANVRKAITSILEPQVDDTGNIVIAEVGKRQMKGLSFQEARDVLGQIGDITQFTGNPSDDKAVNSALKQIYGAIKQETLSVADELNPALASDFRKLTEKYADLSSAEIATKYRDKILERSSLVGLSPQVAGIGTGLLTLVATGGAATPAVLAGITGAVIDKLASSPAFKTRLAALMSQKSPQEAGLLLKKIPALQKLFPKGSPKSPGDYLLETDLAQDVYDTYAKTPNKQGGFINPKAVVGDKLSPIKDAIDSATQKNGSGIKSITDDGTAFRVAFNDGVNPLLINKKFVKENIGGVMLDDLQGLVKNTSEVVPESLLSEARKYKSAEGFEKAYRKNRVWHGTNADFEKFDPNMGYKGEIGTWFTPNSEIALEGTTRIMQRYTKPNLKLATESIENKILDAKELMAKGYRGVKYSDGNVKLYYPNEDTLTKSQLTSIWEKANKK
jgi:hypothetical protein